MGITTPLERIGFVLEKYQEGDHDFVGLLSRVKTALETSHMDRVPVEEIRPYPDQPRDFFDKVKINRLKDSIDVTAQIQAGMIRRLPVDARPIKYELVDGERRWRAIKLIPKERRPLYKCEIIEADDEVVQFLIAGMANFNREGHQPLETAETIKRYHDFGIPMQAVADLLGISLQWAYNIYGLLKLHPDVQVMLKPSTDEDGADKKDKRPPLAVSAAIHISKLPNPSLQKELAIKVVRGEISLNRLRQQVVRVADDAGVPIRMRVANPMRQWERREDKLNSIERFAESLSDVMKQEVIRRIARGHPMEAKRSRNQIARIRKHLDEVEAVLAQSAA